MKSAAAANVLLTRGT